MVHAIHYEHQLFEYLSRPTSRVLPTPPSYPTLLIPVAPLHGSSPTRPLEPGPTFPWSIHLREHRRTKLTSMCELFPSRIGMLASQLISILGFGSLGIDSSPVSPWQIIFCGVCINMYQPVGVVERGSMIKYHPSSLRAFCDYGRITFKSFNTSQETFYVHLFPTMNTTRKDLQVSFVDIRRWLGFAMKQLKQL